MDATFMTALHIYNVRHLKDIHIPLSQEQRQNIADYPDLAPVVSL